jgi:hypothetical protein
MTRRLVADQQKIDQRRRYREASEADEHDRDHRIQDEMRVAPQRCSDILVFHHGLALRAGAGRTAANLSAAILPAHNFYIKSDAECVVATHGCHEMFHAMHAQALADLRVRICLSAKPAQWRRRQPLGAAGAP